MQSLLFFTPNLLEKFLSGILANILVGYLRYINISCAQAGFPSTSPKMCMWPTEPLTSIDQLKKHNPSPCVWQ